VAGLASVAGRGVRVVGPSEGPFVLVALPDAAGVRRRLRALGYAVRRGDTFPGLGEQWLRLAVRDRGTVDGFLRALSVALPGPVPRPSPSATPLSGPAVR
jgi:histidinol-phosphate aminotransferase